MASDIDSTKELALLAITCYPVRSLTSVCPASVIGRLCLRSLSQCSLTRRIAGLKCDEYVWLFPAQPNSLAEWTVPFSLITWRLPLVSPIWKSQINWHHHTWPHISFIQGLLVVTIAPSVCHDIWGVTRRLHWIGVHALYSVSFDPVPLDRYLLGNYPTLNEDSYKE